MRYTTSRQIFGAQNAHDPVRVWRNDDVRAAVRVALDSLGIALGRGALGLQGRR